MYFGLGIFQIFSSNFEIFDDFKNIEIKVVFEG